MGLGWPVPLAAEGGHPELPNLFTVVNEAEALRPLAQSRPMQLLTAYQNEFYSLLMVGIVSLIVIRASRRISERPGRLQNTLEMIVESFDNFIGGVLGREMGRRFLPYLGSLFLFIWFNNMFALVPLGKASTSWIATTGGLALCTFVLVQWTALTRLGPWTYLYHLAGEPRGVVMWAMVPLFLPLHVIGEIAKPLSLGLRLWGNILGEDTLLGVFMMLGIMITAAVPVVNWVGVPLQLPFMFLSLLLGTIQALVFMLLSTIYILLVLPHEEHHE